jgi:hypothetical protein
VELAISSRRHPNLLSLDDEIEVDGKPTLVVALRDEFVLVRPKRARVRATQAQWTPIFWSELVGL